MTCECSGQRHCTRPSSRAARGAAASSMAGVPLIDDLHVGHDGAIPAEHCSIHSLARLAVASPCGAHATPTQCKRTFIARVLHPRFEAAFAEDVPAAAACSQGLPATVAVAAQAEGCGSARAVSVHRVSERKHTRTRAYDRHPLWQNRAAPRRTLRALGISCKRIRSSGSRRTKRRRPETPCLSIGAAECVSSGQLACFSTPGPGSQVHLTQN